MAICVALQADGTLVPTGQAVGECTGYVMVSGSEYGVYSLVQQALTPPEQVEAVKWFSACFGVVLVCFVAGRLAGSVAAMFK